MRGAWVASVWNLNFPRSAGSGAASQKAELRRIVELAHSLNLNALFLQVRPEGDALYRSSKEPWSRFLTGVQGGDPGFDPLAFLIEEGSAKGIAIHAWINPFRAAVQADAKRASNHIAQRLPAHAHRVDGMLWMDPGAPEVRDHILAVVQEIASRYPVAGIHFDDYFYPYPKDASNRRAFPDDSTWQAAQAKGWKGSRDDWRRQNVHELIQKTRQVIRQTRPTALFGVSPFGVAKPGIPEGTTAQLDQFHHIYCDPVTWLREGWVDYLAPQLYWPERGPQSFSLLLRWWRGSDANPRQIPIYPGIALERLSSPHNWPVTEIAQQIRAAQEGPTKGFILWNIAPLLNNTKGVRDILSDCR